ncbi:Rap1a/Tai family immunity protein [Novosphingobium profundi]|uniref:Rap1a/Tai family immunity protein n=1 Tax=Novosphingobium profundi TaxID=1774954 RepID=UPI0039AF8D58
MRRLLATAVSMALLCSLTQPVSAQMRIATGNNLFGLCTSSDNAARSYCNGYIRGASEFIVMQATIRHRDPEYFCVRDTVTNDQMRDIVIKYVRENPEQRDTFAFYLVQLAIYDEFPECGK